MLLVMLLSSAVCSLASWFGSTLPFLSSCPPSQAFVSPGILIATSAHPMDQPSPHAVTRAPPIPKLCSKTLPTPPSLPPKSVRHLLILLSFHTACTFDPLILFSTGKTRPNPLSCARTSYPRVFVLSPSRPQYRPQLTSPLHGHSLLLLCLAFIAASKPAPHQTSHSHCYPTTLHI